MKYQNFDLSVDPKNGDGYPLRAESQECGEARGNLSLKPENINELNEDLDRLAQRRTDRDFLIHFGTKLYKLLFQEKIESLFEQSYGVAQDNADTAIRLRLRIASPEIAALPWEFLYSPINDSFLGTSKHSALIRYLEINRQIRPLEAKLPLNMLVVIPNSIEPYPTLDAEAEKTNLLNALKDLEDNIQVKFLDGNVTCNRISDELLEQSYHCLHYIGHGDFQDEKGVLLLNTEDGRADLVDDQRFASLFRNHDTMKLVVLNSCKGAQISYSNPLVGMAPQLVNLRIPAVVAMQYAISDDAAILFAREFYRSLFKSNNKGRIEIAMSHARNRLVGEFPDDRDIGSPVLFVHTRQGILFNPVKGNRYKDMPRSREEIHTARAAMDTLEENIAIGSGSEEEHHSDKRELQRLKQRLRLRTYTLAATSFIILLMFCLSIISIFDIFGVDTAIESLTMWSGEIFTEEKFSDQITMVHFDEEAKRKFDSSGGNWRQGFANLIEKLTKSERKPKVIVFDMVFETSTPFDHEFIAAINNAKRRGTSVIIGVNDLGKEGPILEGNIWSAVTGIGATCIGQKRWYARTMPLAIIKEQSDAIFSLALKTFEAYRGETYEPHVNVKGDSRQIVLQSAEGKKPAKFGFSELTPIWGDMKESSVIQKGDEVADIIINLSPINEIRERQFSYDEIIELNDNELWQFDGRIVLVGGQINRDIHKVSRGLGKEERYGFELHADAINTILQGVTIRPIALGDQFLIMACLGIFGALTRYLTRQMRKYWRIGLCVIGLIIYLAGTIYIYVQYHVLANTMYHIGTFWLTYWIAGRIQRRYLL